MLPNPHAAAPYLPLAARPLTCPVCVDVGLRVSPQGRVEYCPTLQLEGPHAELSLTGALITRCVESLWRRTIVPDTRSFEVARFLSTFDSTKPCKRDELIEKFFSYGTSSETRRRELNHVVRMLRDIWCLPVCSRKVRPAGYWIATDEADFREWVERAMAEPITTLSTIHRVAKANWPRYAEQLEFAFWQDAAPTAD